MTRRSSSIGCLGCLWFFGLVFFSLLGVGALIWLNPMWIDHNAFWKGEIYEPELVLIPISDADLEAMALPAPAAETVEFWEEQAVAASYTQSTGATVETVEGATIQFPAGSIRGDEQIEVVPVVRVPEAMVGPGGIPIGSLHDIRIGGAESYQFDRPVPISIPFDPARIPEDASYDRIAIGTWENDRWVEVPSKFDASTNTVSAELRHASIEGVIVIGLVTTVGTAIKFTQTGSALYEQMRQHLDHTYKTTSFAIHYDTIGRGKVPADDSYPLAAGRDAGEHPLYVQDVGAFLEDALGGLTSVQMPISRPRLIRYDVFLLPMTNFGASDLGGPVMLDNDFKIGGAFPPGYAYRLHATCVHELVHVGQDAFFNTFNAEAARWWIEATAEFLSNQYLESKGIPLDDVNYYVSGKPNLLAKPWDQATDLEPYAWARFLVWLQTKGVDSVKLVHDVNAAGASLSSIDSALRSQGQEGLGALFMDFAEAFHHTNLWTGAIVPPASVNEALNVMHPFPYLSRVSSGGVNYVTYYETTVPQLHMSATYVNFRAVPFPASANAKLVVHVPTASSSAGSQFSFAAGNQGTQCPLPGSPSTLLPLEIWESPQVATWVSPRLASPPEVPDDVSNVSLLIGSTSTSSDGPRQTVRRWLLMPPAGVTFSRDSEADPYQIQWQVSQLKEKCKHDEFVGYNVYRRLKGDSSFPDSPINETPIEAENFEHQPEDGEDSVYAVSIVDSLGNESLLSESLDRDPFQGEWSGKIVLVKGELVAPVKKWMDDDLAEDDAKHREALARAEDSRDRAQMEQRYQERRAREVETNSEILEVIAKIEEITRLGVPITMEISLRDGKYFIKVTRLYWQETGDEGDEEEDPEVWTLVGQRTLAPREQPEDVEPFFFRLHRENEMNFIYEFTIDDDDGADLSYGIRFDLTRKRD